MGRRGCLTFARRSAILAFAGQVGILNVASIASHHCRRAAACHRGKEHDRARGRDPMKDKGKGALLVVEARASSASSPNATRCFASSPPDATRRKPALADVMTPQPQTMHPEPFVSAAPHAQARLPASARGRTAVRSASCRRAIARSTTTSTTFASRWCSALTSGIEPGRDQARLNRVAIKRQFTTSRSGATRAPARPAAAGPPPDPGSPGRRWSRAREASRIRPTSG